MKTQWYTDSSHAINGKSMRSVILSLLALCALLAAQGSAALRAQGNPDALTKVDKILAFMKSANYAEEELLRRVVWNDKLVNEIVNYRIAGDDDRQPFLRFLDIAIAHYQEENVRLRIILRALTNLDPLVQKYFPQWIVQDEPMILEVMRKIRDNRDDMSDGDAVLIVDRILTGKAKIRVIQSPRDRDNILGILIEKARPVSENNEPSSGFMQNVDDPQFEDYRLVGKRTISQVLQQQLYDRLVDRDRYAHVMETGVIKPTPYVAESTISIPFGGGFMWTLSSDNIKREGVGEIQVSRIRAGFELKIGNDWVNLPFLYAPQWNMHVVYEPDPTEYIKIGPSIPFTWGDAQIDTDFPLFKHRRLNGTLGMSGEYFRQLTNMSGSFEEDASGIGAAAFVSFGLKTLGTKKVIDIDGLIINGTGATDDPVKRKEEFYALQYTATAYYWRDLGFLLTGLRASVGAGFEKIAGYTRKGGLPTMDTVAVTSQKSYLDPYIRLQYDNQGKSQYGFALQYFNGGLLGEAYFNIFSWLRTEVKYARLVFRDPEKWEYTEIIVPGLRIGFNF